jgi:peptidyl-Lys metalloendopeptidase
MNRSSKSSLRTNALWTAAALTAGVFALSSCADAADPTGDNTAPAGDQTTPPGEAPEARPEDLSVTLAADATKAAADQGVMVTVTLTNISNHAVRLLRHDTPLDGMKEDLFAVSRDGAAVEYVGRHYKWAAPQASDFVTLDAGKSLTSTADLTSAYDFAVTGNYTINYGETAGANQLVASSVAIHAEGRPFVIPSSGEASLTAGLTTTGCSSTRISQLTTAYADARTMAGAALTYLTNTPPSATARYVTWFGSFSSTRWNTARTHYAAISSKLVNEVADCTCTDSAYAFVFSNQPYTIHLCNAFWPAPPTGTDSKAGTLIHEMSHFTVVAGTKDNAYGQTACRRLATTSPTRALNNADSHEYFAENTPFQQ